MNLVLSRLLWVVLAALLTTVTGISQAGVVSAQTTGSLTVLRMNSADPEQPVVGVPIMINQVLGMEPTSQDDLAALAQDNPELLKGEPAERFGPQTVAVTNSRGEALFRGLNRGVYLVREIPSRNSTDSYLTASAFLVSVPTIARGAEDVDVVVQTKPQPVDITLHADRTTVRPGEDVQFWSIAGVPDVDAAGMLGQYVVVHAFDKLLTVHRVSRVRITGDDGDLVLTEGVDYEVTIRPAEGDRAFPQGTTLVGVTFTPAGLEKLAARRAGNPETRVITDIETTVKDSARAGDRLYNQAFLLPDGWDKRWDDLTSDEIESNVVVLNVVDDFAPEPDSDGSSSGPWWPWWPGGVSSSEDGSPVTGTPGTLPPDSPGGSDRSGDGATRTPGNVLRDSLASTGASVIWLIAFAVLAVLLGLFLIGRERRRDEDELGER